MTTKKIADLNAALKSGDPLNTEQLAWHLQDLKSKYPGSVTLGGIEDLEAELRKPLIDFAAMAEQRGRKPDTLSKALRQGRATLPFPVIDMGPRTRHFRALEVRLWVAEEIRLDLPPIPSWVTAAQRPEAASPEVPDAPEPVQEPETLISSDPVKKAIFGAFGTSNRNGPT